MNKRKKEEKEFDNLLKRAFEEYRIRENEDLPADDELRALYPPDEEDRLRCLEAVRKKERSSAAQKVLKRAAVIVLAVISATSAALMMNENVRASVLGTITKPYKNHFLVSFTDEGFFDGADIDDIAVGYVPEGYVLLDTYEKWKSEFPESRLIVICDPEKNPEAPGRSGPGSVTVHIRTDVNVSEFSDETLEMAEEISINGMAAVWAHADFEYEGEDLAWGKIVFGNKNLVIEIQYIGVDHDEALKIAEGITGKPKK
ncbi:MAG: hypothetical protein IJS78_04510 [Clostridia bacterium]|nr:hypothetical protein [Clostridia bacterium]